MWKFVCQSLTCEQALLFGRVKRVSRERAEKMFLPLRFHFARTRANTWTWQVSIHFRGKKPVTDLRVFVLKVQARSPRLFHCLALISFFAKTENPNHTETLALAWLLRLLQGGFARGLEAFEFVTEIVRTCVSEVEWLWGKKTITSVLARGLAKFARAHREPQVAQAQYESTCGWSLSEQALYRNFQNGRH